MAVRYSTGCLDALLGENGVDTNANGLRGLFKGGCIVLYTGTQPASANNAATGTPLAIVSLDGGEINVTIDDPTVAVTQNGLEFGAPSGGIINKSSSQNWQYVAFDAGTVGWFRLRASAADDGSLSTTLPRIDGSAGSASGDMILSNLNLVIGAPGTIDSFKITFS